MSTLRPLAFAAALVAAGAVGYSIPRPAPPARIAPPVCARQVAVIDEAALRAALRAELANLPRTTANVAAAAPVAAPVAPPQAAVPSAEAVSALADAQHVLDGALARHRWGSDDARAFRQLLARVDDDGRQQLLSQLAPAINDGRLELATAGMPF